MKLAAGYVRCSTDEQGATSIPQQKVEIEKWAKTNQFEMVKWFIDEGRSGTSFDNRPAFRTLTEEVQNKSAFGYVLVYDESRWGRAFNPRESNYWKLHFERFKVKVRIINTSSKNEDDIGSYVMEVVESAEASEYSKKLSRSIRRGMLSEQQSLYSRGGTAPYGYKRIAIDVQTGERKALRDGLRSVPRQEKVVWELGEPLEVQTVKRIFELKANGLGYVGIADVLNSENIPCPKRGRWRNVDQKWSGGTIHTIIQNPVYTGDRVYNRLSFSKFVARERGIEDCPKVVNDRSEWVVGNSAHPAIVTGELFENANRPVRGPIMRPNQHYYRSTFLLTGLIKCTRCTFNYQGHNHKKSGSRYYVDGGFINKGKSVCSWHSIKQDVLEKFILGSVKEVLLTPQMIKRVESSLQELFDTQPESIQSKVEILEDQIRDTQSKLQNLVAMVEKGMHSESISTRIDELEHQLRHLRKEKGLVPDYHPLHIESKKITQAVTSFLNSFEKRLETVPFVEKKELIRMVVEKILVDKDQNKVICYIRQIPRLDELAGFELGGRGLLGAHGSANGNRTRI